MKINYISPQEHPYTTLLTEVDKSIKSLYFIGKFPAIRVPTVAIIGTRKPTTYGKEVGYQLAYQLAAKGVVIVSGLAYGIDAIAHTAALDAGGMTIAILPTSLQAIYPAAHRRLAQRIIKQGGALVTEYDEGTVAYKGNFIARNRIVSGISDGILIIEAAARSGTTATAGFALEQGKSVMAVPGNITSPMSIGCNALVQSGARPVLRAEDVLEEIGWQAAVIKQAQPPLAYTEAEQVLLRLMSEGLRDQEALQKHSGLELAVFQQTMTMLEISGSIRPLGAGQWGFAEPR